MRSAKKFACALLLCCACDAEGPRPPQQALNASAFPASATADSLLDFGEVIYRRSEYDSAVSVLTAGRDKALANGDSASVARADTWLGLTAWKQGRNEDARRIGETALAMKLRLGFKADLFRSYNALGLLAWVEGRYSDASELFGSARLSAEGMHDTISIAKAIGNLGLVHSEMGEFEKSRREFETLAEAARHASDTISEANALSNLGMTEVRAGDAVAAVRWLQRARELYGQIAYPSGEESVLGQLGSAYSILGQPQRAIAYMDSAMSVARSHGMVREETEDLQIYAELLGEAGDHRAGLKHLARARVLADSAGLGGRAGDIARAEARELVSISRSDLALSRAGEAVRIHRKTGALFEELKDRLIVAEIAQGMGRNAEARSELARAGKIAHTLNLPVALENLSLGTARVADRSGDAAMVLRALPTDLSFPRMGPEAAGEAFALRARAFARLRQWPEAVSAGQRAVVSLRTVREGLGEGPLRAAYTSEKSGVYADLVIALLHLGRTSEAFEVADAARGKALLEHLGAIRESVNATSNDLAHADQLLRRIDYLTERLRSADTIRSPDRAVAPRNDLRVLAERLSAARGEYEDRMRTVARTDPRSATLLGAAQLKSADVQKALRPGEAMLQYLATRDSLFVFVADRDTVIVRAKAISLDDLGNRVRIASQLAGKSKVAGADRQVMHALYDILVAPIETLSAFKQSTTLLVVPHSALAYLPFAALMAPSGQRLIETRAILTLPSASALPFLRSPSPASSAGRNAVFAPFPEELAGTREEAFVVRSEMRGARSYFARKATEAELRSALAVGGYVHVASHAVLNQTNPMFSHIELAVGKMGDPENNGTLEVHELLRIPVRSELVFLSGCETGAGAAWSTSFRRSQDYATLSQAILFAGAQNVVATLWRIDDLGASVFAQRFYEALPNRSPVEALAIAQRKMIRDARYSAPRYWAGYTISGAGLFSGAPQKRQTASVQ